MTDDEDRCACGKSIDEVSFAHYLSCGDDAPCTREEAESVQERVVARIEAAIGTPCDIDDCAGLLRRGMATLHNIDITVTTLRPIVRGLYTRDPFVCPHKVAYWMEPTGEQIAKWAKDGVS